MIDKEPGGREEPCLPPGAEPVTDVPAAVARVAAAQPSAQGKSFPEIADDLVAKMMRAKEDLAKAKQGAKGKKATKVKKK